MYVEKIFCCAIAGLLTGFSVGPWQVAYAQAQTDAKSHESTYQYVLQCAEYIAAFRDVYAYQIAVKINDPELVAPPPVKAQRIMGVSSFYEQLLRVIGESLGTAANPVFTSALLDARQREQYQRTLRQSYRETLLRNWGTNSADEKTNTTAVSNCQKSAPELFKWYTNLRT